MLITFLTVASIIYVIMFVSVISLFFYDFCQLSERQQGYVKIRLGNTPIYLFLFAIAYLITKIFF